MPRLWQKRELVGQSLYKGQLTTGNRAEINSIGTCIKWASKIILKRQNFSTSHALRTLLTYAINITTHLWLKVLRFEPWSCQLFLGLFLFFSFSFFPFTLHSSSKDMLDKLRVKCTWKNIWRISFYLTHRFQVALRLFSNRSQMTSKCGKNKKVVQEAQF